MTVSDIPNGEVVQTEARLFRGAGRAVPVNGATSVSGLFEAARTSGLVAADGFLSDPRGNGEV
jgi:hypothetical protein